MNNIIDALKVGAEKQGANFGVYVGRLCPMHFGHQAMIQALVEVFQEKHTVFIGSCNKTISIRHLFSYEDRSNFVRTIFPEIRIAPLPDFETDESWFRALDDMLVLAGADPLKAIYIGGCEEDVDFYYKYGRGVHIVNRYGGATVRVEGRQVRDALIEKRELDELLDPRIIDLVKVKFDIRWNEVRNR